MHEVTKRSRRIGEVVGVIEGIAFQTNILALNAAAEAARAGDKGRGFSAVAGEVRSLADHAAQAAREIKELISDSAGSVRAGVEQVQAAERQVGEILESTRRVCQLTKEVNGTSKEQIQDVHAVERSMVSLDRAAQENNALVERLATAAEGLLRQARVLEQSVAAFHLGGTEASDPADA